MAKAAMGADSSSTMAAARRTSSGARLRPKERG